MVFGPGRAGVIDVPAPLPAPDEVVVAVERVGLCGTDAEFYTGDMAYLRTGDATYPMRLGHEWAGRIVALGARVAPVWAGRRVTGDTMLGCQQCSRCRAGKQHVCADRAEVGVRRGRPGALAEQLAVPVWSLQELPDEVDATKGALVEPGANSWRAVDASGVGAGSRLVVIGPGTIGLLCAMLARARGASVVVVGIKDASLEFAKSLGFGVARATAGLGTGVFDAAIDATNAASTPFRAVELVQPGGRVVFIGLSAEPSLIDSRALVLADLTAVGILSGSPALAATVSAYRDALVDPSLLVAATVGLAEAEAVLAGRRPAPDRGPKIHVDPRR